MLLQFKEALLPGIIAFTYLGALFSETLNIVPIATITTKETNT